MSSTVGSVRDPSGGVGPSPTMPSRFQGQRRRWPAYDRTVIDKQDAPLSDPVVIAPTTPSLASVQTFSWARTRITGSVRPLASPNVGLRFYAQFQGHKSDTKDGHQFRFAGRSSTSICGSTRSTDGRVCARRFLSITPAFIFALDRFFVSSPTGLRRALYHLERCSWVRGRLWDVFFQGFRIFSGIQTCRHDPACLSAALPWIMQVARDASGRSSHSQPGHISTSMLLRQVQDRTL